MNTLGMQTSFFCRAASVRSVGLCTYEVCVSDIIYFFISLLMWEGIVMFIYQHGFLNLFSNLLGGEKIAQRVLTNVSASFP